ncbi:uncharacterized protein TNCV_4410231 [Trichonephila clavipes]|nr:uncharacterized protein TNCV_4410231 [Trichonephila clavipes]
MQISGNHKMERILRYNDESVVELLEDWNVDVPSWKYPMNLESPRVSSPGFGNDSKMMLMLVDITAQFAS